MARLFLIIFIKLSLSVWAGDPHCPTPGQAIHQADKSIQGLFQVHTGTPVPASHLERYGVPEGSQVFLLGQGEEGRVYRVIRPDGRRSVLKIMKDPDPYQMKLQTEGLQLWSSLKDKVKSFQLDVTSVTASGKDWFELPDAEGLTLDKVLQDPGVDPAIKQDLRKRFQALKTELVDLIKKEGNEVYPLNMVGEEHVPEDIRPTVFEVEAKDGTSRTISIKPSNLLIDPVTLKATCIDPL